MLSVPCGEPSYTLTPHVVVVVHEHAAEALAELLDCPSNLCDLHCHMTGHAADMELRLASTIPCVTCGGKVVN